MLMGTASNEGPPILSTPQIHAGMPHELLDGWRTRGQSGEAPVTQSLSQSP